MRHQVCSTLGLLFCAVCCGCAMPHQVMAASPSSPSRAASKPIPLEFKPVKARVKPYRVSASLKEVANSRRFQGTSRQKKLLAQNLFVVIPTDEQQLFYIYENNDYGNMPSFVTTDLVLQLYHIFYDFTLRKVETEKLMPLLGKLTKGMFHQSVETWKSLRDPKLKPAALRNVAYFGVAARSLGLQAEIPKEAQPLVAGDLTLIQKHQGFGLGSVFPYKIDYSQFVPRGHYTRSENLKRFFKTMMWYGLAPFAFRKQVDGTGSVPSDVTVRMGLLLVRNMYQAKLQEVWETIYKPTAFYVGFADDLTPAEYKRLMDEVFGKSPPVSVYSEQARFDTFVQRGEKLRLPLIRPRVKHIAGEFLPFPDTETCQLRFMGQRHIPDSEITQRVTVPLKRYLPSGMDVMAVLGIARARWLLDQGYPEFFNTKDWKAYKAERQKLEAEFRKVDPGQWTRNMYWAWLWTLQSLGSPAPAGYPSFMRNDAWQDKSLNTALSSWAELRHDTILYGKQSLIAAECGGGGEKQPPKPKGYVEPNLEFYHRLQILTRISREGLARRNLLTPLLKTKFGDLEDLLAFLSRVSEKELTNQKLTNEEYEQIGIIGATVERMTLSVIEGNAGKWYEITSPTDRDMAVVADVHTGGFGVGGLQVLEEGVGHVNEILVIVPIEGRLMLTRGGVFSYCEFRHPYRDRLTDEKWQAMLKSSNAPKPPLWTKTFLAPLSKSKKKSMKPMKVKVYSSGC